MSEFDVIAQDLLAKAQAEEQDQQARDRALLDSVLAIYGQKYVAEQLRKLGKNDWSRETLNRWVNGKCAPKSLTSSEEALLRKMLPSPPAHHPDYAFRFIDLFAGIGGIRQGFDAIGGQCVFTSEWNKNAVRTYKANWYNDEAAHTFNSDIREVTLSDNPEVTEAQAYAHIDRTIPDHDVLLAGFPCQPFSLAGVSKKNALGRAHGFECEAQGTLFFDVARIIKAKQPAIFVLENVKNLKSHDKGKTFSVIMETLDELGYEYIQPQGAFYLFVKSPSGDGNELSERAKKHELLLVPSDDFGVKGYVRISYCVSRDTIERSLPAFRALMSEYIG